MMGLYKWIILVVILVVALFVPQILEFIYPLDGYSFTRVSFTKEQLLSFFGSYITFLGTAALGALALWQNEKANKTNERLLKVTMEKENPILSLSTKYIDGTNKLPLVWYKKSNQNPTHDTGLEIKFINKSSFVAKEITVTSASMYSIEKTFTCINLLDKKDILHPDEEYTIYVQFKESGSDTLKTKYLKEAYEKYQEKEYYILELNISFKNIHGLAREKLISCDLQRGKDPFCVAQIPIYARIMKMN